MVSSGGLSRYNVASQLSSPTSPGVRPTTATKPAQADSGNRTPIAEYIPAYPDEADVAMQYAAYDNARPEIRAFLETGNAAPGSRTGRFVDVMV